MLPFRKRDRETELNRLGLASAAIHAQLPEQGRTVSRTGRDGSAQVACALCRNSPEGSSGSAPIRNASLKPQFRHCLHLGDGMKIRKLHVLVLLLCLSALSFSQDLASFEKRTTVKKLANGLTVIICERPEAPVFSFFTHVDAGSVQDPSGQDRPGAHVRAHGVQGNRHDWHARLRGRESGAGQSGNGLRGIYPLSATSALTATTTK